MAEILTLEQSRVFGQITAGLFPAETKDERSDARGTGAAPAAKTLTIPITDGEITVNGKKTPLPIGVGCQKLTGAAVKTLLNIYQGLSLYFSDGTGAFRRVRDNDAVRITPDQSKVKSVDERPKLRSTPRYQTD